MSELNDFNQTSDEGIPANQGKLASARHMPLLALDDNRCQKWLGNHKARGVHERWRSIVHRRVFRGGPKNPPWYHNLVANPEATVELGSERFRVRATATSGKNASDCSTATLNRCQFLPSISKRPPGRYR